MAIDRAVTRRAATLADVARRAGVSIATASKALNGRPDVGEVTRARVSAAAKDLSFHPNLMARSLMSGRTDSVGLLTNDFEGRFVMPTMMGAEDALGASETVALMANSRDRVELEQRHLQALLRRRVDGLILVGDKPEPRSPLQEAVDVPVVYAYAPSTSSADVSVVPDHHHNGQLATQHLLDRGCTRIAHIAGPFDVGAVGGTAALLRAQGYLAALAAAGLEPAGGEPRGGDWVEQWGWQETDRMLRETPFDGLVCSNDQIARGAIDLLTTRGMRVPEDVAVIGFDNWLQIAGLARLPQTSIEMDLYEVGRIAARGVLQPGALPAGRHKVPGRVIERESTARGPSRP